MIETIFQAIKTILESVDEIEVVYDYPVQNASGYPYAIVEYSGSESETLNNVQDKVTYEFRIRLIQEKIEDFKGRDAAETTARDRAFTIEEAFRADNDLSTSGVLRTLPMQTTKEYVESGTRIQLSTILLVETIETITA